MAHGIPPGEIDGLDDYDMQIYRVLIGRFENNEDIRMQNNIKKAISDMV